MHRNVMLFFSFGPSDALVVALGIPSTAWVVDDMLKVWFRNGVTTQAPQKSSAISRWWQVRNIKLLFKYLKRSLLIKCLPML